MLSRSIAAILFDVISPYLISLSNDLAIDNKIVVSVSYYSSGSGKKSTVAQGITSVERWSPISDSKEGIKMWGITNFYLSTSGKKAVNNAYGVLRKCLNMVYF